MNSIKTRQEHPGTPTLPVTLTNQAEDVCGNNRLRKAVKDH